MVAYSLKKINEEIEELPESEQLRLAKMILDRVVDGGKSARDLDFRDLRGMGKERGLRVMLRHT
jgi:hypothetical protein